MSLFERVHACIKEKNLLPPNATIIVGLSGGPDSVFLLRALYSIKEQYSWNIIAAHVNHGWRDEASQDQEFCSMLCQSLNIPFIAAYAKDIALTKKPNGSKEELGRLLRRTFFEKIKEDYTASHIVLAHHADDQIETFFIRLLRGTGIEGLAGMSYCDGSYVRPLLHIRKSEIIKALQENNISYCIDASNDSSVFLRNRIRNNVIPALQKADPRFEDSCLQTITRLQETQDFVRMITDQTFNSILKQHPDYGAGIYIKQFVLQHPTLKHAVLLKWLIMHSAHFTPTQAFFEELQRFIMNTKSNTHQVHPRWSLIKVKNILYISKT